MLVDAVTHWWLFQLNALKCLHLSAEASPKGWRSSSSLLLCIRLCFKALLHLNEIIPGAKLLKVNGPQHQKKPGEGLLPGICVSAGGSLLTLEHAEDLQTGNAYRKKHRHQWIPQWLALCKPRYILKILGKKHKRGWHYNSKMTTQVSGSLSTVLWHAKRHFG